MLIVTARLPRRKLAFSVAAAALVCCAALALNFGGDAAQAAMTSSLPSPKGVKTNEDRVAYLESFGWTVEPEPLAVEELLIPEETEPMSREEEARFLKYLQHLNYHLKYRQMDKQSLEAVLYSYETGRMMGSGECGEVR